MIIQYDPADFTSAKLSAIRDDKTIDALELAIVALLYGHGHTNAVMACESALRRLKGE